LACDRRAVVDPEILSACLDAALSEVLGLGTVHRSASTG
jgi:hypothetical protein